MIRIIGVLCILLAGVSLAIDPSWSSRIPAVVVIGFGVYLLGRIIEGIDD